VSKQLYRLTRDPFLNRKVRFTRHKIVASRKYLKQFSSTLKELDLEMDRNGSRLLKEFGLCLPTLEVLKCLGSSVLEDRGAFPSLKELHVTFVAWGKQLPEEVLNLRLFASVEF
jgi:hypothetical protein